MSLILTQYTGLNVGGASPFFIDILTDLGLLSNLYVAMDVADLRSYDGSSQTWSDQSGNGYDFFRGPNGSATGADPTFNGVAGDPSESTYWSFDGGDFFTNVTNANPPTEPWVRNNATFTIMALIWTPNFASNAYFYSNLGSAAIQAFIDSSNKVNLTHLINNGGGAETLVTSAATTASSYNFVSLAFDENANLDSVINGNTQSQAVLGSTESNPYTAINVIGAINNSGSVAVPNTTRLIAWGMWNSALTLTQMSAVYTTFKQRRIASLP